MLFLSLFLLLAGTSFVAEAQDSREIWDSGFRAKRPMARASGAPPHTGTPSRSTAQTEYKQAAKPHPDSDPRADSKTPTQAPVVPIIGVTMWRVRPVQRGDADGARLLTQDREYVAERIRTDTLLRAGERVRLGFEAPREGYLYVIDRERYSDGSYGDPYLIFPATNINGGDHRLRPGRLIEVPGQMDAVQTLAITPKDTRYSGEDLLVLLTPERLSGIVPGARETRLPRDLVDGWLRQWDASAVRLDMTRDGDMWTTSEKSAGASQRLLTQDDPLPQSIYAGAVSSKDPVLVRVLIEAKP